MSAIACSTLARPNAEFAVLERVAVSIETGEVHLPVSRAEVIRTYRQGDDLVVEVADGRLLLVEEYFADDSMADGPVLLTTEGPDGQMAVLELDGDGEAAGTQPVALGRLEEMFSVDGDSAGETPQTPDAFGLLEESSDLTGPLLIGGTIALAAIALTSSSDSDGSNPDAAALARINGGTATLEDWGRFGVEVAAGATEEDRENLLASLTATVEELGDLSGVEAERIGYAVERAATVNVGGGYARVVDVDFDPAQAAGPAARSLDSSPRNHGGTHDTLNLGVDTDGDGTADQTANFDTEDGYRPVGARFDDGTASNGTDESHQYHYRDEDELAVRADIDGAGTGNADGTVDRIERDTNGDGRADSAAESNNDGVISRIVPIGSNSQDQALAMGRIDAGTASWEDFRTAGVDVDDLGTPSSAVVQAVLDVLAIAKETGNGNQPLSLLQVQGIVSLMHYNYVLRETDLVIDRTTNEIKGVDQTSFASLGDTDEWHYEEWDFDGLANNRVEFSVAVGTSDEFPSQLDPDQIYQLDFSRMLGFRQISANIDFDADGAYDVSYVGEYSEDPEGSGNYDFVSAEFMAGGEYNMGSLPSDSLNLGEILDLGALESITLHADATKLVLSEQLLLKVAAENDIERLVIRGDSNDEVDFDPDVTRGADGTVDGETFHTYEVSGDFEVSGVVVAPSVSLTVYIDPDISVDV